MRLDCSLSETNCLYSQRLPRTRKQEKIQQAGVKCKRRETRVRRSARVHRHLLRNAISPTQWSIEFLIRRRVMRNEARDNGSFSGPIRAPLSRPDVSYMNRYAAVVNAKTRRRHLQRENRERIHYDEVSVLGTVRSHVISQVRISSE